MCVERVTPRYWAGAGARGLMSKVGGGWGWSGEKMGSYFTSLRPVCGNNERRVLIGGLNNCSLLIGQQIHIYKWSFLETHHWASPTRSLLMEKIYGSNMRCDVQTSTEILGTDQRTVETSSFNPFGVTFSGYFVFIRRCFNSISSPLISLGGNWKVLHIRLYCSQKKLFHNSHSLSILNTTILHPYNDEE